MTDTKHPTYKPMGIGAPVAAGPDWDYIDAEAKRMTDTKHTPTPTVSLEEGWRRIAAHDELVAALTQCERAMSYNSMEHLDEGELAAARQVARAALAKAAQ